MKYLMFDKHFSIEYGENTIFYGNLQDSVNKDGVDMTLKDTIIAMLIIHHLSALIFGSYTLGVIHYENRYKFTLKRS